MSLIVAPGERIVLTGPSGAGKSTLLALLLRFTAPAAGSIAVGDRDLAALDVGHWRRQIGWVPQQPYLFSGTAADNIALGEAGASREAICRAARMAGAADFIEALPAGYDTPLGERGLRLSAGQRQRIALARAFLRDAPLLLMDEPTAHLDPASARLIGTAIDTALADRTVILVSHGQGWEAWRLPDPQPRPGEGDAASPCCAATRRDRSGGIPVSSEPATARGPMRTATGRRPLLRLLWLARPLRVRLALSVLAGAAATGCGVALLATSGFLLARASEHPSILAISVAVVAVRAFSVGRGVARYLERLTSHDVAFRVLADIRVAIYRRLERLAPAGLAAFRSGDLLAALISDVDATQDLFIRGHRAAAGRDAGGRGRGDRLPADSRAGRRGAGSRPAGRRGRSAAAGGGQLPAGGPGHRTGPRRTQRDSHRPAVRGGRAARVRRAGRRTRRCRRADGRLTALARRFATATGLGSGLIAGLTGLTLWGVLVLGVAAVGHGTLTRVPLAVLCLTALASFEAVAVMPTAALQLGAARASARRIGDDPGCSGTGRRADGSPAAIRRTCARATVGSAGPVRAGRPARAGWARP